MANFGDRVSNGLEFERALQLILPGASARAVQRFFERPVDLRDVARWRSGRGWPPDWAVAKVRSELGKIAASAETRAARIQPGPGRKGNRATLRQYRQPS